MRFFNTAGPVNCKKHYCLPPLERFRLDEILNLIDQEKYFVLHAPRQTGKTSCLLALTEYLNTAGKHRCLYLNVEAAQGAREDVYRGIRAILSEMTDRAEYHLGDDSLSDICQNMLEKRGGDAALNAVLSKWSIKSGRPLVLLIDEIDSLIGDTLISVLRQLRAGYDKRPGMFPQSIILCGVRDVRDYRIRSGREKAVITGGSAFNIKAESLRLGEFSRQEAETLYRFHTDETGQKFSEDALDAAWELSEGQPWLVNALGYEICFKKKADRDDRSVLVTGDMVRQAAENLILRRETHIDQLADKLKEERVRRVIEPLLAGDDDPGDAAEDDILYVRDLGLIKLEGSIRIANRIYREVIPRALTYATQVTIAHETLWYVRREDGSLDTDRLISAFQDFFRKHSEKWSRGFHYREASAQLLMQAFLGRIINSGGRITREYGLGRKRTDLLLEWQCLDRKQEIVIELKIRYGDTEKTIAEGLRQIRKYMDKCGTDEGHLVIFDRRKKTEWDEKIFRRDEECGGRNITVWGM